MTAFLGDDEDDDGLVRELEELFARGTWVDGPDGSRSLQLPPSEDEEGEEASGG